jgi:hypothetical protein
MKIEIAIGERTTATVVVNCKNKRNAAASLCLAISPKERGWGDAGIDRMESCEAYISAGECIELAAALTAAAAELVRSECGVEGKQ